MATEFTGSSVLVNLFSPPNAQVRGTVLDISSGQLYLGDVHWIASGRRTSTFEVPSSNIKDLEVISDETHDVQQEAPHPVPVQQHIPRGSISPQQIDANGSFPASLRGSMSQHTDHGPPAFEAPTSQPAPQAFADPAILSFGKPPPKSSNVSKPRSPKFERPPIPRQMLVEAARMSPTRATPAIPAIENIRQMTRSGSVATATLSEPFDDLSLERSHEEESEAAELGTDGGMDNMARPGMPGQLTRRQRRRQKELAGRNGNESILPSHPEEADSSPVISKKQLQPKRAKGAKPPGPATDKLAVESAKPKGKKQSRRERAKSKAGDGRSGWATEDATDIQELGDFDFMANLSKFDKREIFRQLKEDDTVSAENRLVGHNRLPKPGTAGGKNLHWTENVLDTPHILSNAVNKWTSEAGESEEENSDAIVGSERSSRRNQSRASMFRARTLSRKGSGKATEPLMTSSITSMRSPSFATTQSPKTKSKASSPFASATTPTRPTLRLADSNKPCPSLSPLQMLEFEQFAVTELALSEDVLTENAARGIAEAAVRLYRAHPDTNTSQRPGILVAVGNHRAGARTLAAARHLRNHGFFVTATIMERDESEYIDAVRQQALALRKAGGTFMKPASMLSGMTNASLEGEMLIEALLGVHRRFEDLRGEDQAWFFEMVMEVNRGEWEVLSVDVPSGVDATSGELTQTEPPSAHPLAFNPTGIVFLCVPKPYLSLFRQLNPELVLYVVDIGIGSVVWKRLGSRRNRGIEWGDDWIKELKVSHVE